MRLITLLFIVLISINGCNKCYKCNDGSEHCKPSGMTNKEWKELVEKYGFSDTNGVKLECH